MVRAVFWRVTANGDFAASKEAAWPDRRSSDFGVQGLGTRVNFVFTDL